MLEIAFRRATPVLAVAFGAGIVVVGGTLAAAALLAMGLVAIVAFRPAAGAYTYLAVTPLVAGITRDLFLPVLRIHEALLVLIIGGLMVRGVARMLSGHRYQPRFTKVDIAVVAVAITGSMVSLLWRFAQGEPITSDDILYASVFWKYLALYVVFRVAIRTSAEATTSLSVALGSTAIVAFVGVLQALGLFGVPELLFTWYPAFQGQVADVGRGASTLALTFAVADICLIAAAAALSLLREARGATRNWLYGLVILYVLGAIAAGQFSGFLGIVVATITLGIAFGDLRRVLSSGQWPGQSGWLSLGP